MRQRIPFRFSEDGEQEGHIMDEQEQDQVIDRLRQESVSSNTTYLLGLQAVVGLSIVLHTLYILRSQKQSPLAVLFPDAPAAPRMPLASILAWFQVAIHCNLSLNLLPPSHPIRRAAQTSHLPPFVRPPIPLSHPASLIALAVAPVYALLLGQSWVEFLWWSTTGILAGIVGISLKWIEDEEAQIAELERLRYTARGA
ncbi:hypothetical protein BV20DRAFT_940340 [Pilatotrama ljubarskyi]|nr:hypothetical protein BV20DRAFT_940340 [Pilatotrama ljubarskyi]